MIEYTRSKPNKVMGIQPVLESFHGSIDIDKVFVQKGLTSDKLGEIRSIAKKAGVPISVVPVEKLNRLADGTIHQGVVAYMAAIAYSTVEFIVDTAVEKGEDPFLVLLDEITDVRNFGAIARSCECAGAHGLIIPAKGSAPINEESMKSSAGALNHIPVARVKSLINTVKMLKDYGIKVISATEKANKDTITSNVYLYLKLP